MSGNSTRSGSFMRILQHQPQEVDEKWWLPVPCVPSTGPSEKSMKHLFQKRDCAYQIHKVSLSINNSILAEMEIPESYLATLPKNGKASVGDNIYRYMYTTVKFSPGCLLDSLDIGSEHEALEFADKPDGRRLADIIKPGCVNTDPNFSNKLRGTDISYPGGLWLDPHGWESGYLENIKESRTKEIKNGRLSMVAVMSA
ncbi:unnamed protein product [Fraxinus pennsylvanica]|uniref:PRONE domain-containing protein n=1 Tax=Fraxinus pennsylvanica TaxID=56036 RepID=A0AAD1ZFR2_9LAMI|nr:unnamed protein product [Fraxinus pennsylvanica]